MTTTTIREFLIGRGQNLSDFACLNMERESPHDGRCLEDSWSDHVKDIKRFGELVVQLDRRIYWSGWPGVRNATVVTVHADSKKAAYHAEDVYIDGGYQTHHLDKPDREFEEVIGAEWNGTEILVRVKSNDMEAVLSCKPYRVDRVTAEVKEPNKIPRILEEVGDLTEDETDAVAQRLQQKFVGREYLVITVNGGPWVPSNGAG